MKKLLALIFILPFFMACDNIPESDRYIDTGPVNVQRKVLLEEFTGQRCVNCPDAHRIIESLEEQYGSNLIVVSIHAGPFGVKVPMGLRTTDGDTYAEHWGVTSYPAGVVDRNSGVLSMDGWASVIRKDIELTSDLQLSLSARTSEDGETIEIFTTMVSPAAMDGFLQLWIVESGIVAFQIDGGETINDYVHNNVFRAAVNGLWGEATALEANVVKYVSNTISIDQFWNKENLSVVGFYYTSSGVVQVEKCAVDPTPASAD